MVGCLSSIVSAQAPRIRLEPFLKGVEAPIWMTHDGTERLFVVEQVGRVRLILNGQMQAKPYLDISEGLIFNGEQGLLSVVFHPDFARNGYLYANYTRFVPLPPGAQPPAPATQPGARGRGPQRQRETIISEFKADPKADTVDPTTERIIMRINQPYPNHNGGQILFGPADKMLYIGMGDGGSANDPQDRAQNMMEHLGKVLRIDVTPREGYAVPPDNPFVGRADAKPEIWAVGLRNPWRMSFDRQAPHLLWTGDVGQNLWEEVDIIKKGGNYGWNRMEGLHEFPPGKTDNIKPEYILPVKEYHHTIGTYTGLSITGGYVYRGKKIPSLVGWYLFADYSKGTVWGLKYENDKVTGDEVLVPPEGLVLPGPQVQIPGQPAPRGAQANRPRNVQPSSFGEDLAGELYICDLNGTVYKIVEDK